MARGIYNFLDPRLKPKVSTRSPITDGYEVTNLISDDYNLLSKGFLAYSAIKPPVDIDFELICSANLHYIIVWATVESQKTSGIEIIVQNSSNHITICKVYFDEPGIVIYNRKFYSEQSKFSVPSNFKVDFFKSNQFKIISCIEKFRLRIFRTASSVPCIGKIEIWGDVSYCSDITKQTIACLFNQKSQQYSNKELHEPSSSSSNNLLDNQLNIPEDFIDLITCEIMSLPMTLPCGKTIDRSTLDKHGESEAKWGRAISDPFTGQQFTSNRHAVLNVALKNRIDEFLLQNAHRKETQTVARTVGRLHESKRTYFNEEEPNSEYSNKRQRINMSPKDKGTRNLDDIIENAFKNYNIVRFSTETITEQVKNSCGLCNNYSNLYVLLCTHFICRQCLTNVALEHKCKICSKLFTKSEVKKYHDA